MNIAINCWNLRNKNIDGIGNVIIETISRLIRQHPEIHFQVLCDKNFNGDYFDFPNVQKHFIFPPYRHPALYMLYLDGALPLFLKKNKTDVFVGMDGMISLRTACRQLAVIHDLNFEHYPKDLLLRNRLYYRFYFPRFARKATRIVAVSEYTKKDLIRLYHVDPAKIDVMHLAAKEAFQPLSADAIKSTRSKYSGGHPYFFFVGSMHPRKNIPRLLQAFDRFKAQTKTATKLILAGNLQWKTEALQTTLKQLRYADEVIFTGRIDDPELVNLLGASQALVFVPTFEGFGLPIVEGFQAGVPVICSNTSSMPEVAGEAALLVDPFNVDAIARAMKDIATNEHLRNEFIRKGSARSREFSWDASGRQLYQSIRAMIAAGH
ncbi:hypothetical protein A8C56_07010 [Niabella ginsenosidivorans]|uniref:Glycosyl transferase family 1 n=1 Tax=Niabella ginsenosidivorans TaxID=1176587 RepID=A0A1A9I247_9BACT|nr:glycosyltransferase family 1 protein [Niabella ginsenosidivorans]ANH80762.1 hypothetical protein A8C56_07010 [Niabella ginsenosidivorans]